MSIKTNLRYPLLLIASTTKKTFTAMGTVISKTGDTVKRLLNPAGINFQLLEKIAVNFFSKKSDLVLVIDDTLVKKIYSQLMEGSGRFYDTKLGKRIMAYKLLCSAVTDGRYVFPLWCSFLFAKELLSEPVISKDLLVKQMVLSALKLFPHATLTIAADGAFATKDFLLWCNQNGIRAEVRMHSNRKVLYKGKMAAIRDIKALCPKGRQMARTIQVLWHNIPLHITAQRRIDKHGEESIVFQASTFDAKPSEHVKIYKKRWPIEMLFRTTKQHLGLQECQSRNIDTQLNHISSVFVAFSLAQLERMSRNLDTPEESIRALEIKKIDFLERKFSRLNQIFGGVYA